MEVLPEDLQRMILYCRYTLCYRNDGALCKSITKINVFVFF